LSKGFDFLEKVFQDRKKPQDVSDVCVPGADAGAGAEVEGARPAGLGCALTDRVGFAIESKNRDFQMEDGMAVITISRQFGAGGRTIGQMVAKSLGYTFVGDEIVEMIAAKAKVSENWVASMEKEAGGKWLRFTSTLVSKGLVDRVLGGERGDIDEEVYGDVLKKILNRIADEDNAVILGRGGQYLLRDRPNVFHVLLIDHVESRIKFLQARYNMSLPQAIKAVQNEDHRRANLFRHLGRMDFDHPELYHIALNQGRVSLERSARMICRLVAGGATT
jgi:cytidylate kinase